MEDCKNKKGGVKKKKNYDKTYVRDEEDDKVKRAGVLPRPPWRLGRNLHEEHLVIDVNPPFPCAPPRIAVFTDYEISRSIKGMTMLVMKPVNVAGLRRFLTGAFDTVPGSFALRLPGEGQREIEDHEKIPTMIVMDDGDWRRDTTVRIHMENGATFMLEFDETENHFGFLRRVARIIGRATTDFVCRYEAGHPWIFPYDLATIKPLRGDTQRWNWGRIVHAEKGSATKLESFALPIGVTHGTIRTRPRSGNSKAVKLAFRFPPIRAGVLKAAVNVNTSTSSFSFFCLMGSPL